MTHIRPLQFGEFADVVYNGQRGELGLNQTIATIVEALEAIDRLVFICFLHLQIVIIYHKKQ